MVGPPVGAQVWDLPLPTSPLHPAVLPVPRAPVSVLFHPCSTLACQLHQGEDCASTCWHRAWCPLSGSERWLLSRSPSPLLRAPSLPSHRRPLLYPTRPPCHLLGPGDGRTASCVPHVSVHGGGVVLAPSEDHRGARAPLVSAADARSSRGACVLRRVRDDACSNGVMDEDSLTAAASNAASGPCLSPRPTPSLSALSSLSFWVYTFLENPLLSF